MLATVRRTSLTIIIFELLTSAATETLPAHPAIGDSYVSMARAYRGQKT
jgi:hypothetical protein